MTGIHPEIVDPWASERDAKLQYGVTLTKLNDVKNADCIILAVAHNQFKEIGIQGINKYFRFSDANEEKVIIDVKGVLNKSELDKEGFKYWRL